MGPFVTPRESKCSQGLETVGRDPKELGSVCMALQDG